MGPVTGGNAAKSAVGSALGLSGEDFLQLLVTQLRYQNPLAPMDNLQFMTELAQFAVLQELITLRSELEEAKQELKELAQASAAEEEAHRALGLIGMEVVARDDAGGTQEGVVTGVRLSEGTAYLLLGETAVRLDGVVEVRQPAVAEPSVEPVSETEGSDGTAEGA